MFFVCAFVVFSYFIFRAEKRELFTGNYYNERVIQDFDLTGHNGKRVRLSQFRDKLILLSFGYTSCPDICPATLSKLKNVYNSLGSNHDDLQVLFISIDPERDNADKLKDYVPFFHNDFIGLTGTVEELKRVADIFKVAYFKEDEHETDYLMSHPTSIYLINRNNKLILKYPHSSTPKSMVQDIKKIL